MTTMTRRTTSFGAALATAVLLASVTSISAQAPPAGSGSFLLKGYVRVIDGDTFEFYIHGHQTGIGLIGIKAPQGNTPCGSEATHALQKLIARGNITIEEDPVIVFDARKRRMYYVVLPDGSSAAVGMAATGLVRPNGEGREKQQIAAAAAAAAPNRCTGR